MGLCRRDGPKSSFWPAKIFRRPGFLLGCPQRKEEFTPLKEKISAIFDSEGYENDIRLRDKRNVKSALLRFKEILFELGLSPGKGQNLSIRIKIDMNPPAGAETATTAVRKFVTLNLLHYDRPSLLAGKLHALIARPYAKGRDLFDLVWYLADPDRPEPNFILLNNALIQTGWLGPKMTPANWRRNILERLEKIPWDQGVRDVSPFLERPKDVKLLTLDNAKKLLLKKKAGK